MADLITALRNAHNAGDTKAANRIAAMIKSQQSVSNDFVPTDVNLAATPSVAKPDTSLLDKAVGVGEAALTLGTGATGGALGYVAGSAKGVYDELTGATDNGEQTAIDYASSLTYAPKTESGQDIVESIGDALQFLPPVLGTVPVTSLQGLKPKMPNIGAARKVKKSKLNKAIVNQIKSGSANKEFVKKMVNGADEVVNDSVAIETIKQGMDDGVVAAIKGSSDIDKRRMLQMVDKLEKGKVNAIYAAKNRPADVAGDSLLRQVDFIKKNNSDAGKQLNRVASKLKGKDVDVSESISKFIGDAEDMGVSFDEKMMPNFEGSTIETIPPAKKLIKDIALKIRRNDTPDAFQAHEFKKFIDENVTFGKSAKGLGGKTERVAKKLRASLNEKIGDSYPEYKEANARFSDTISVLDGIQDASGSKVNLFGPNSDKALGTVLRRLMSNAQSRVNMMDSIDNINSVSKKYGGSFGDDILTQMLFADELDSMFGTSSRTGFAGEAAKGIKQGAGAVTSKGGAFDFAVDLADKGVEKVRGINDANAIKSIKELLKKKRSK